jgi:hypothetical protein
MEVDDIALVSEAEKEELKNAILMLPAITIAAKSCQTAAAYKMVVESIIERGRDKSDGQEGAAACAQPEDNSEPAKPTVKGWHLTRATKMVEKCQYNLSWAEHRRDRLKQQLIEAEEEVVAKQTKLTAAQANHAQICGHLTNGISPANDIKDEIEQALALILGNAKDTLKDERLLSSLGELVKTPQLREKFGLAALETPKIKETSEQDNSEQVGTKRDGPGSPGATTERVDGIGHVAKVARTNGD